MEAAARRWGNIANRLNPVGRAPPAGRVRTAHPTPRIEIDFRRVRTASLLGADVVCQLAFDRSLAHQKHLLIGKRFGRLFQRIPLARINL